MKALIYKDFCMIRKLALSSLFMMVLLSGIFIYMDMTMSIPFIFVILSLMFLEALQAADEQSNFSLFALSAPIHRKEIILSRYIFNWGISLVAVIVMAVTMFLTSGPTNLKLLMIVIVWLLPTVANSVLLPFMLKFGSAKGRIVMAISLTLLFLLLSLSEMITKNPVALFSQLLNLPLGLFSLIILGFGIILNVISYIISQRIMAKKEY